VQLDDGPAGRRPDEPVHLSPMRPGPVEPFVLWPLDPDALFSEDHV